MKNLIPLCCALIAPLTAAAERPPFSEYFDASVQALLHVESLPELRERWETHPFRTRLAGSGLGAWIEAAEESPAGPTGNPTGPGAFKQVLEDDFGLTVDDLFELLPGQMTIGVYNLTGQLLPGRAPLDVAILAAYGGSEERLEELMQIQFERNAAAQRERNPDIEHTWVEERFMGETLHFDEVFDGETSYIEDGYALVDGIFILATPEERLRSAVKAVKAGAGESLADDPVYQRARETGSDGDLALFFNLQALLPPLNTALTEPDSAVAQTLAIAGVTGRSLSNALALDALEAFYFDAGLIDDGILGSGGLIYEAKRGLLSLLEYTPDGLPEGAFVPASAVSSSLSSFDISASLANLEQLLAVASPGLAPMVDLQIRQVQEKTGVNLRTALLDNLDDAIVTLAVAPERDRDAAVAMPSHQLYAVKVKDPQALSRGIESFKDLAPQIRSFLETQEYEGHTIHTFEGRAMAAQPAAATPDISYVVTRTHLIVNIGRVGLLQEVLTRMAEGASGLWQRPETEALFDRIARADAVSRSYLDLEAMSEALLESLRSGLARAGGELEMATPGAIDLPFVAISENNEAEDAILLRWLLVEKEETE